MTKTTLLTLAATLLLAVQLPAEGGVLRIGTTNSPPLSLPDQSGMLDRLLLEAFRRTGVPVEFISLPSERSLVDANNGTIDGDNNRVIGLEKSYPGLVRVPESNMTYDFMAFAIKPGLEVRHWGDLATMRVAFLTGWKILEDNVRAPELTKLTTATQLFLFLKAGRADVVLYDRIGGRYNLRQLGISEAYAIEPPLARREMYLYLHQSHADLVPALAEALRSMKRDGTYDRIFDLR